MKLYHTKNKEMSLQEILSEVETQKERLEL